jgi:hypothetical protein
LEKQFFRKRLDPKQLLPFIGNYLSIIDKISNLAEISAMANNFYSRHKFRIISVIAFIIIIFLLIDFADNRKSTNERILDMAAIDLDNFVPEDCKRISDSLDIIKQWKRHRLKTLGNSITTFFIGVSKIDECDSCNTAFREEFASALKTKYFIQFPGYTIKEDASFFINKDKYYISYTIWDTLYPNSTQMGHKQTKEVRVRYATGDSDDNGGSLLIPISEQTYDVIHVLVTIFTVAFIVTFFFLLVILPYNVVISIATGTPFTRANIKRLYIAGWTMIGGALLTSLIPWIIELFLRSKLPDEIYFPFLLSLTDAKPWLIAGVVVLLVASAFKRGYKLQQDQDLTI